MSEFNGAAKAVHEYLTAHNDHDPREVLDGLVQLQGLCTRTLQLYPELERETDLPPGYVYTEDNRYIAHYEDGQGFVTLSMNDGWGRYSERRSTWRVRRGTKLRCYMNGRCEVHGDVSVVEQDVPQELLWLGPKKRWEWSLRNVDSIVAMGVM